MKSSIIGLIVALIAVNAFPLSDIPQIFDSANSTGEVPFERPGIGGSFGEKLDESNENSKENANNNNKVNLNIYMNGGSGSRTAEGSSNSVVVNFNFNENEQTEEESNEVEGPIFARFTGLPEIPTTEQYPSLPDDFPYPGYVPQEYNEPLEK